MPAPDPILAGFLEGLEPPAAIFTNARADYVRRGLETMGVRRGIGNVHDIASFSWRAKPEPSIYEDVLEREGAAAADVAFVDDRIENLAPARSLGMSTVLVDEDDRHSWLDMLPAIGDSDEASPYRFKIRHARELAWLAMPRLGVDGVGRER